MNAVVPDDPQKELVVRRPELPIVSVTRGPRHAPVQKSLHGFRHRDMRGLYKHLKMTAGLGGRKIEGQQAIKDENGNLLRDKRDILRRWERFFGNLLNTKSRLLVQ